VSSSSLTCYLTQRDTDKLKSLLRGKLADGDIKEALQRLDRHTQDELKDVAAQTLGVVSGEQMHSACNPMSTVYPLVVVVAVSVGHRRQSSWLWCHRRTTIVTPLPVMGAAPRRHHHRCCRPCPRARCSV